MGVDIITWRCRIGGFILRGHDLSNKNNVLMKTKWLTVNIQKYLLFCAILLIVCGDVEENPGPSTANFPLKGTIHQGDDAFSDNSRGRQCVPCCLSFFVYNELHPLQTKEWHAIDLDRILYIGDFVYRYTKSLLQQQHKYLLLNDLPKYIILEEKGLSWSIRKTYFGNIAESYTGDYPLLKLEYAFYASLSLNKYAVLVCKGNAIGVMRYENEFLVFDSHCRDKNGMCCSEGTCIILKASDIPHLCIQIRSLFKSLTTQRPLNEQFELHSINICEITKSSLARYERNGIVVCCISSSVYSNQQKRSSTILPNLNCQVKNDISKNQSEKKKNCISLIDLPCLVSPVKQVSRTKNKRKSSASATISVSSTSPPKKRKHSISPGGVVATFHDLISRGPEYVCTSCSQVFFRHSVVKFKMATYCSNLTATCVVGTKSVDNGNYICRQCHECLKKNKIPPCSIGNKLRFPDVPVELQNLTQLERLLVSPRIPFMQIKELPRGGQIGMKGNVVNVPADVNTTVRTIPRNMNESETIPVKFKRSLSFKNYIAFEQVRPDKILKAAKWLVSNSKLFQNEGIVINEQWENENRANAQNAVNEIHQTEDDKSENIEDHVNDQAYAGNCDTLLHPADFREFNRILNIAPAEGNHPLSIFQDKFSEFLCFPTIYCGQPREDNNDREIPLHYSTICKWELRNVDRRVAQNITNLFYKLKKVQIKQIADKVSLALRKCKMKDKKLTVREVLSEDSVNEIMRLNEGYKVLRTLRGSPPYWERAKKDIYAMIRQLGIPTWFCSFSSAETKWLPLLRCLGLLIDKKDYSDTDLLNMPWLEKCRLIKSDPITCSRYFDHKVQMFINNVLRSQSSPIGKISDFFYRVEFQQRGSPHIHMLVWVQDALILSKGNDEEVVNFIDSYVTCKKNGEIEDLVNYQTHRHAPTCRKKGQGVCRFGFPLPPLDKTMILYGLKRKTKEYEKAREDYDKILLALEELKLGNETSFTLEEFLQSLKLSYSEYLLALASNIKEGQAKVFLKRNTSEIRINNYNDTLLKCWEANMDIQYILDPYACAAYIVSYMSKGQRGMSNLLRQACEEASEGENDIRHQVRRVGNAFLTHVEVGAQEASYILLQMPLRRATREFTFINTNIETERVVLLKSHSVLSEMPQNSTSVEADNVLKRYQRRPSSMEKYCLAEYVAYFNVYFVKDADNCPKKYQNVTSELPEENYDLDAIDDPYHISTDTETRSALEDDTEMHNARDGSVIYRRKAPRIIYSVAFDVNNNRENYFRELIMLYVPWRNESKLMEDFSSYEEKYCAFQTIIDQVRGKFVNANTVNISQLEMDVHSDETESPPVTELEHQNELDAVEGSQNSEEFGCFNPGVNASQGQSYDIGIDFGIGRKQLFCDDDELTREMLDGEYREMVQSLNLKQKEFFYHILHLAKTTETPIYNFLSGGAGVGKSVLLKALYQALLKFYSHKPGENPDDCKILVCAPTGKAAYNVGGLTIHSAFNIPAEQGFKFKPLDMQQLCAFQTKFKSLKIVFIDEISMVGKRMFNFINLRLQEIMGCTRPFGGVSVIVFGDLFQLKPVMDSWLFAPGYNNGTELELLGPNIWQDLFSLFELVEIMRQKEDLRFAQLLNRLREGNQLPDDIRLLNTRTIQNENESTVKMSHLFTRKLEVANFNRKVFDETLDAKKTIIEAIDSISGEIALNLKKKILSKIPVDTAKTKGLAKFLHLAEELPAELCINIDILDGLTNGTPCTIKKLDFRVDGFKRCSIVWVLFHSGDIGKKYRNKYAHLYNDKIAPLWTPVLEVTRKFQFNYYNSFQITRRQFPITLASAKTVHKAQGCTLPSAVVHLGSKKMEHMYYVALSRVQNLSSLYMLDFNDENIKVSVSVMEEMCRLRSNAQVHLSIPLLYSENGFKILYHNTRSLHKHIVDLRSDFLMKSADILALSETRF